MKILAIDEANSAFPAKMDLFPRFSSLCITQSDPEEKIYLDQLGNIFGCFLYNFSQKNLPASNPQFLGCNDVCMQQMHSLASFLQKYLLPLLLCHKKGKFVPSILDV